MSEAHEYSVLEGQIRECFGRVVYTHKTHSKMADRAADRLRLLKFIQILLTSITASGTFGIVFTNQLSLKVATAIISLLTLTLTTYMKGFDLGGTAQKHRDVAADIWPVRESYLSLLADIVGKSETLVQLRARREVLQKRLTVIYKSAPGTDSESYRQAGIALKRNEEYTFSDEEIDRFLPQELRKLGRLVNTSEA